MHPLDVRHVRVVTFRCVRWRHLGAVLLSGHGRARVPRSSIIWVRGPQSTGFAVLDGGLGLGYQSAHAPRSAREPAHARSHRRGGARGPEGAAERRRRARASTRRARVVDRIRDGGDAAPAVYGVNTGFGFLADVRISADEIRDLQRNLIRSHAAGVGAPLPEPVVRAMMLLARRRCWRSATRACAPVVVRAPVRDAQPRRAPGGPGEGIGRRLGRSGAAGAPGARGDGRRRGVPRRRALAGRRGARSGGPAAGRVRGQGGHLRWSTARSA